MIEWYFGFYTPSFRDKDGKISPACWLGHCEVWGYNDDETWLFMDPGRKGFRIWVMHRHDDVLDQLAARHDLCDLILRIEAETPNFRFPPVTLMSCAAICGALVGIRALLPSTLRRKLRAKGAVEIHEETEGRPG